jgi:hypothetical protein
MRPDDANEPQNLSASEYVRALFATGDNVAVLIRNRSTRRTIQRILGSEAVASPSFQTWLTQQNAGGADIYVGMNPLKDGAFSRTKSDIKVIRHVYLDLDRHAERALQTLRNSPDVPAPNFVLDTSQGKHQVVWKVSGVALDEAESLLESLAHQFGGDLAATDATRVLRLPGFRNQKPPGEFTVRARQESTVVHQIREFPVHEGSPETVRDADIGRAPSQNPTHRKSQSERDWAYAKRALARGDDPELVIRRIADYRGIEKYDPDDYARRTVTKAQVDLRRETEKSEQFEASEEGQKPSSDHHRGAS